MNRSNVNKKMAALVALGVLVTACASDGDDDSAEPASEQDDGLFADPGGDEESGLVEIDRDPPDEPMDGTSNPSDRSAEATAEESAGEPSDASSDTSSDDMTAADAEAPAERTSSDEMGAAEMTTEGGSEDSSGSTVGGVAPNAGDAEGGLFGAEPPPPDDSRLEDNTFESYGYREFVTASSDPLSTFALDVDTGSYTVMRRWLDEGQLPPIDSVRPEEYINAFDYGYDAPRSGLEITVDGGPSPFDDDNILVRVGVQGEIVDDEDRGPAALTFVIDTSGSMDRDDRLGLVKDSLEILVDELDDDDTVAIVTYSDASGVVLRPTSVRERDTILDAIDRLQPGGSTNLESGLRTGYELASEAFRSDGINRVVLASDGVANVGVTDPDQLAQMIRGDADRGINLVTVGFGMGNFNDVTMEQLADQGDGFYAYVDTDDEAERLFEDELTSTLLTIAKDAKIQVEFDDEVVEAYRLIGFENRGVLDSEFRNDEVDAGELGAGHQVTAVYEVELRRAVSPDDRGDLGEVFLRWEDPTTGEVFEIDEDIDLRDVEPDWNATAADFRLATVVTVFAELMRDNPYADRVDIGDLAAEADRIAEQLDDRDVDDLAELIERAAQLG
jgi:Ca-activated chloride channel family protein